MSLKEKLGDSIFVVHLVDTQEYFFSLDLGDRLCDLVAPYPVVNFVHCAIYHIVMFFFFFGTALPMHYRFAVNKAPAVDV